MDKIKAEAARVYSGPDKLQADLVIGIYLRDAEEIDKKLRGDFNSVHEDLLKHGKEKGVSVWLKEHGHEKIGKIVDDAVQWLKSKISLSRGHLQASDIEKAGTKVEEAYDNKPRPK